jgi:hypothetical protein
VDEFETLTLEDDGDGNQPRGESPSPVTANGSRPNGTGAGGDDGASGDAGGGRDGVTAGGGDARGTHLGLYGGNLGALPAGTVAVLEFQRAADDQYRRILDRFAAFRCHGHCSQADITTTTPGHDRTAVVIESDFLLPDGADPPQDLQHYCQTRHTDDECDDEPDR